jgi:hypothetical protein
VHLYTVDFATEPLPGFPQLFSDVPHIAQCTGATLTDVPEILKKASFLTVTQTVSNSGAAQTSVDTPVTSAQPGKTPNEPPAASSALAPKEQSSVPAMPGSSVRPAQPSTNIGSGVQEPQTSPAQAPAPSPSPALAPSQQASTPGLQSEEALPASASAVLLSNLESPVQSSNGKPVASPPAGQASSPAASELLSNGYSTVAEMSQIPPPVIPLPATTLTANSASQYVAGTQTLIPGGSAISISGTAISLAPSGTVVVVGGSSTMKIVPTAAYYATGPPAITLAGTTLTANSASQYVVDTQTMIQGGPAITVSGTVMALAPSGTAIILGGSSTIDLPPPSFASGYNHPAPSVSATPTEVPIIVMDGQTLTLTPDSSATDTITVDSIPVYASGSYVIYGNSTIPMSAIATAVPNVSVYTSRASAVVIGSQTLVQGGSAVTLEAGTGATRIVSWATSEASLMVVSQGPGGTSTAEEGLGGYITQGLGGVGGGNATATQTSSVVMYTGGASSGKCDGYRWFFFMVGVVMVFLEAMS